LAQSLRALLFLTIILVVEIAIPKKGMAFSKLKIHNQTEFKAYAEPIADR
jgi:hypothetical protein